MNILVLDKWFFVQLANFIVMLVVLNTVLIAPIRRILRTRAEAMAAKSAEIDTFTVSADAKIKDYQSSLDKARQTAAQARMALREEGLALEKTQLEAAGQVAAENLKAARGQIAAESQTALTTMLAGVSGMATKAAGKILGQAL